MYWMGLVIGLATFGIIGVFHPIVIKAEYYLSKKCWPIFLVSGIVCIGAAAFIGVLWVSALMAVLGFTCLWSIGEVFDQEKRVRKGWFPANPKRVYEPWEPKEKADKSKTS